MAITRADVLHVSKLARLELDEPEVERLINDLGKILAYVDELHQLDTTDVPETAHVAVDAAPLRDDVVEPGCSPDVALSEAPKKSGGGFAVPAFVDEG
jgi:aspartyl-tRNA(Asn)/glutamyl-tRNA(Gln) amidotransferase subunit C